MGAALRDGYRQRVFLMTKFDGRTKESATQQIDESRQRIWKPTTSTCFSFTKSFDSTGYLQILILPRVLPNYGRAPLDAKAEF